MISQQVLIGMVVTLAAMVIPFWGWGRMLSEVQTREDKVRERKRAELLRRQQEREEVMAALLPVAAPADAAKKK